MAQFPMDRFSVEDESERLTSPSSKLVVLNSADDLYADLRDRNFNGVATVLKKKAGEITSQFEQRHSNSIEKMRSFVSQLPQLQASKRALATHTTIAELIKEKTKEGSFLLGLEAEQELLCGMDTDRVLPYIEDAIARKGPILQILRLLCIQSLVNGGLRSRIFDYYRRELIQTYGLQILEPLNSLEKSGLLCAMNGRRNYATLKRMLRLIIEDHSEIEPTDICFAHTIYAPISVRLIQKHKNWNNMKDILDLVPGPTIDHTLDHVNDWKRSERSVVLVFYLGGCTYAEVSALRFLSQREESNVDYVVATTKLINGNSFLKSIMLTNESINPDLFS